MVYAKLAYLAFIACLCQVSDAQSLRRVRPGCAVPRVVPRVPAPEPCRPYNKISDSYGYQCNLDEIISKLVNALIYTVMRKDGSGAGGGASGGGGGGGGGGAGGGKGSGGGAGNGGRGSTGLLNLLLSLDGALDGDDSRLLGLDLEALGQDLVNLDILRGL